MNNKTEPDQVKRWVAFLRNHKDDIAAMDLFAVPTASLRLLYGFFVIGSIGRVGDGGRFADSLSVIGCNVL